MIPGTEQHRKTDVPGGQHRQGDGEMSGKVMDESSDSNTVST